MKNQRWKRTVLLMIAAVFLMGSVAGLPADAAEKGRTKVVRVGYVLFENYQEGGEGEYKRGFGYEYLQKISYATGWKYEYVYGSFGELLQMLKDGQIDLMGDLSYTPEREKEIYFSALPQGRENFFIYTTVDQEVIDPFEPETLEGRRIAVTSKSYQQELLKEWLAENGCQCDVVEYDSAALVTAALGTGEVDAIITTDMASSGGYVPVVNLGFAEFFFGVSRIRPDLLVELNAAMQEVQTTDPYYNEATYSKYITSSLTNSYLSKRERQWLEEHNYKVRLGYLVGNLPYCDETEERTMKGLLTVIVDAFQKNFGVEVKTIGYRGIDQILVAAEYGEIDLFGPLYSDFWLAEQIGVINSDEIATTTPVLIYYGDYTEETTQKIAYVRNNAIQQDVARVLFPDAEYVQCKDQEDCLNAVKTGRASCIIASAATINLMRQYSAINSMNVVELPQSMEICLGTLRGNSELLNITNRVIFASRENLHGTALMENAYTSTKLSLVNYMQEHAIAVIITLVCLIAFMLGLFLYYHAMFVRFTKMKTKNEELSRKAFWDGLTKVGNRAGYLDMERELQELIDSGKALNFALMVADVNGLKAVNDTLGHEAGDQLIQNASTCITEVYANSPVYRIGGDEFVVVLTGLDYERRGERLSELRRKCRLTVDLDQIKQGSVSMATGMSEYDKKGDHTVSEVFARADEAMYAHKKRMKAHRADS